MKEIAKLVVFTATCLLLVVLVALAFGKLEIPAESGPQRGQVTIPEVV
jgi:hypothetical protein